MQQHGLRAAAPRSYISHAQAMRVSPARCRLQRLHDVPCVEGTSLQCVHPTAGGDRVAFRADNAREHTCKPARAKVRFAKSCVCRSGEGLHLTLARSGQLSCCHVRYSFSRYSFSASKCMRAIRKVSQSRCVRIGVYSQTCATHHASRLMCCETTSYMYSELELYTPQPPIDCVCVSDLYPRLRLHR